MTQQRIHTTTRILLMGGYESAPKTTAIIIQQVFKTLLYYNTSQYKLGLTKEKKIEKTQES